MNNSGESPKLIGLLVSVLLALFAAGMVWAITTADMSAGSIFAYVAGLVMVITPCSLPIFLVITSLSIKQKKHKDSILIAASFGAGFVVFAVILGAILALTGQVLELPQISSVLFAIGGAIGYTYAMSQLFGFHIPLLGLKIPQFKENRNSYVAAFSAGLILSVGDVGCPNPFRYVLLSFIAASGNLVDGASLGFLYGLGAITPMILVALVALLGVNLGTFLSKRGERIEKIINFSFVPIGAFLITFGLAGEMWYESTIIHDVWESILLPYNLIEPHGHIDEENIVITLGNSLLVLLIVVPFLVYFWKSRKQKSVN